MSDPYDITGIIVHGKEFISKTEGNTYQSVRVTVWWDTGEEPTVLYGSYGYGGGGFYKQMAMTALEIGGIAHGSDDLWASERLVDWCNRWQIPLYLVLETRQPKTRTQRWGVNPERNRR